MPLMMVSSSLCNATNREFIQGNTNEFTIEPKLASGAVLRDVTTAAGFAGLDLFLTESYVNNSWYADQGIATYNPVVYEVQAITFPASYGGSASTTLSLADYLTPFSPAIFATTSPITPASTSQQVQAAIQTFSNVNSVDVSKSILVNGKTQFLVTFLSNLGDVDMLVSSDNTVVVSEYTTGICEIQTFTLAADVDFIREVQSFRIATAGASVTVSLFGLPAVTVLSSQLTSDDAFTTALESFVGPNGQPVSVVVSHVSVGALMAFSVQFFNPVGDVPTLSIMQGTQIIQVIEAIKGVSPISGTFTLFYEGQFTNDIAFDGSAATVKAALEALSNVGTVGVTRVDNSNGFKWTVSFVQNVGNLRMMLATPNRYEIQKLWTSGGSPTPLSGSLILSYGNDSVIVDYDSSANELVAGLSSMSSIGDVEVSQTVLTNGQFSWMITFRSLTGQVGLLGVDASMLLGSDATAFVQEVVAGNTATLQGFNPRLAVMEKVPGNPSYTSQYIVQVPGSFSTRVSQLHPLGLFGQYYDNQWLYGEPSIERVDPTINFDWSTGLVTATSSNYVSIRWTGKMVVSKSEMYTFYLTADDSANLYFNHSTLINGSAVCCVEHRASIFLTIGVYYDIVIEYRQLTGAAAISLMYSSASVRKQVVPATALFYTEDIVGSPFQTQVVPGSADFPYTTAFGDGVSNAIAGNPTTFFIQTKDQTGNNQSIDYELYDPADLLSVTITGGSTGKTVYYGDLTYLGNGLFTVSYLPLSAGQYTVSVKMGVHDIFCGLGEANACSPFDLLVVPGPTVPMISEAESPADEIMDYLVEAVAGEYGYFYIQAKDAFGNNQIKGGDQFTVLFTLQGSDDVVRGSVDDHKDGTYTVHYTIKIAGQYTVAITLETAPFVVEPVLACVASSNPHVFSRYYDGVNAWYTPSFCTLNKPTLRVVHHTFNAPSCTYEDGTAQQLAYATVGIANSFTIQSRDQFGNIRQGDSTTHFSGYGDGESDYFLTEFTNVETNDYYRVSSSVSVISASTSIADANPQQTFKLAFGGLTTLDIPNTVTALGLEAILESLQNFQLDVVVTKTKTATTTSWTITFLSMLNVWQSRAATGPAIPMQILTLVPPTSTTGVAFYNTMSLNRPAQQGWYPVSFTLWTTGTYQVRITSNGIDIQGSPTTIFVSNAPVDPTASFTTGQGLIGGIAGNQIALQIQAKDTRQAEVQYIISNAYVTPYTPEIQTISLPSS